MQTILRVTSLVWGQINLFDHCVWNSD